MPIPTLNSPETHLYNYKVLLLRKKFQFFGGSGSLVRNLPTMLLQRISRFQWSEKRGKYSDRCFGRTIYMYSKH